MNLKWIWISCWSHLVLVFIGNINARLFRRYTSGKAIILQMLSCNLYNNYFFNWSAFWSTFQKLTIALSHKPFGGAGRPNSALHLKPFCRNCVWSALALGLAGSLTLGVWKSVCKDKCPEMFTCQILIGNYMMYDWSFFFFFFFISSWLRVSLELETCLCWKNHSTFMKNKRKQKVIQCVMLVSPEPQWFQFLWDLPSILSKSKADCLYNLNYFLRCQSSSLAG